MLRCRLASFFNTRAIRGVLGEFSNKSFVTISLGERGILGSSTDTLKKVSVVEKIPPCNNVDEVLRLSI